MFHVATGDHDVESCGVVVENELLVLGAVAFPAFVVVASEEDDPPVEAVHEPEATYAKGQVTDEVHHVIGCYVIVVVLDQHLVHVVYVTEWPVAVFDDVAMVEVVVGRVPDIRRHWLALPSLGLPGVA